MKETSLPPSVGPETGNRAPTIRLAFVALVLAASVILGLRYGLGAWLMPPGGPPDNSTAANAAFSGLLKTANGVCSSTKDYFLFSGEIAVYELADYRMYPRRAIRVTPATTFDTASLAGHMGDCLVAYGKDDIARADRLMAQSPAHLSRIGCATNSLSCLYVIK